MGILHSWKRREKIIWALIVRWLSNVYGTVAAKARSFFRDLVSSTTIMIVFDDERRPRSVCIPRAVLILALSIMPMMIIGAVLVERIVFSSKASATAQQSGMPALKEQLSSMREITGQITRAAKPFSDALDELRSILSKPGLIPQDSLADSGSILGLERKKVSTPGVSDLANTQKLLDESADLVKLAEEVLESRMNNMAAVPSIWPVQNNQGHITTNFGNAQNPFTGQNYKHTGLDISNARQGDPVVATADGIVASAGFHPSYGNMVILEHGNGYATRYAHMQSFRVRPGQKVTKGTIIGRIGNTGVSTGPHVHYEVYLGGNRKDPMEYIDLPSSG